MRNTDRVLVLERRDATKKDIGLVDPKILTGGNRLHAVMLPDTMWVMKYEHGMVPPQLKDRFTSFPALKQHAETYFSTRNLKIKEVID